MRRIIAWTLTMAVGLVAAKSALAQTNATAPKKGVAPATGKAAPAPAPMDPQAIKARQEADLKAQQDMNILLDNWEAKSKLITSLDVEFYRTDDSKGWGTQYFFGRAMLKSPDLACLEDTQIKVGPNDKPLFVKDKKGELVKDKNGKPIPEVMPTPNQRIVCNGKEVLQYEWDKKVVYVYPLEKEVRQKALQEGPLPFLFNMKAADVKKRYGMALVKTTETDYIISILPREDIDKQSFSKAFISLNKKTFLPSHLLLYPTPDQKQGAETKEYTFTAILPNKPMREEIFQAALNLQGWKVIQDPVGQGQGQAQGQVQGQGQKPLGPMNGNPPVAPQQKRQSNQSMLRPPGN